MNGLLKWTFYGCLVLLPLSCWQRDTFVADLEVLTPVELPPAQSPVHVAPFDVLVNDIRYQIEPLHDYELYGLVVSFAQHNGERLLHRSWNDHLNVADVCVVWGRNASELDLNAFEFRNGQFTCFFRTRDSEAWRRFDLSALANNHLISDDDYLRDRIGQLEIGDQIRISGWLASYRQGDGFQRGTSTTRDDTGNGACETIYVRDFEILSRMRSPWRMAFDVSAFGVFSLAFFWVWRVVRSGG